MLSKGASRSMKGTGWHTGLPLTSGNLEDRGIRIFNNPQTRRWCQSPRRVLTCLAIGALVFLGYLYSESPSQRSGCSASKKNAQNLAPNTNFDYPQTFRKHSRPPLTALGYVADAMYDRVGSLHSDGYRLQLQDFIEGTFPASDLDAADPQSLIRAMHRFLPPPTPDIGMCVTENVVKRINRYFLHFLAFLSIRRRHADYKNDSYVVLNRTQPTWSANIFQTGKDVGDIPQQTDITKSWTSKNVNYTYRYFDDAAALKYVAAMFDESVINGGYPREGVASTYKKLAEIPVMQSDFFRYIAIAMEGGVYSDLDTTCLKPIDNCHNTVQATQAAKQTSDWPKPAVIVAIELDASSRHFGHLYIYGERLPLQLVQWTFAGARGHPIFIDAMRRVIDNIAYRWPDTVHIPNEHVADNDILDSTGPTVLTQSVLRYLGSRYNVTWPMLSDIPPEGLLFGDADLPEDVLVLSVTAFQPGHGLGAAGPDSPAALVYHHYAHSWAHGRIKRPE